MKRRTSVLILVVAGLMVALPVHAQRGGPNIEDRLDRQQTAIQRGIDSGELTRGEAKSLKRDQRELRRFIDDLRHEGYPPHEARRMIDKRLDRAGRRIQELSNNHEVAYRRDDRRGPPPQERPGYDDDSRYDRR
ncbi:hypothetical protein CKO27_22085 [Thiocystis violacea]|nr:hypothetical protein [Thiocystis violacea]